jgi:putative hydrolase of the HAD superfamily
MKAILFDLDDTLWPIVPVIERAERVLHEWLVRHAPAVASNHTIDSLRARRQALMATDPVYQLDLSALRHAVLVEAFESCGEEMTKVEQAMAVFSTARNEVTPFGDVMPVLHRLQERVALGSVSNGVADLQAIGIAHFFKTSIAAYRFGRAKPDPAIFHAACDALDVTPQETVYVGDDLLLDVYGAQQAGLLAIWLNRPELSRRRQVAADVQPDATCTTLYEVEQWLHDRMTSQDVS